MNYPGLDSPEIFLIMAGLLTEITAFVFYTRFKLKARRFARTGRVSDIEIASNWQSFFGAILVIIPALVYWLH